MSDDAAGAVEFDAKGLDSLIRALDRPPTIRVGILGGNKNTRTGGVLHSVIKTRETKFTKNKSMVETKTNAEIGAIHEFGGDRMPQRSFLRAPISEKLQEYLELSRAFDESVAKKVVQEGTIIQWLKKVAVIAEQIVSDAFDSRGFGRWKASNMAHKQNHQTLVETQQLRNSITSEVKA